MEHLQELAQTGSLKSYRVTTRKTVRDLLKELKLESKFFAILVDGHRAELDAEISEGSEITILPKIAGG
jgi:sulfur carrier protein ThiS